ncbi:MAG: transporter substrate-binding domain-containing protein [Thermodesulfovibrionales bacterium]
MRGLQGYINLAMACLLLFGCASEQVSSKGVEPELPALRIGVTPNYPPIVFKLGDKISGVEAEFASLLGDTLGRRVQFVELPWDQQIPALLEGKTDVIMSGMTITEARKIRVDFAEPYLKSGLYAAMRTEDVQKYDSLEQILKSAAAVGVMENTSGQAFVQEHFRNARIVTFSRRGSAAFSLKRGAIDLFVDDGPAVAWTVSENEAYVKGFWTPLNEEYLAWAVSRGNPDLLLVLNDTLRKWRANGTLTRVIEKWLPYLKPAR